MFQIGSLIVVAIFFSDEGSSKDVLLPILIVTGCLLIAVLFIFLRMKRFLIRKKGNFVIKIHVVSCGFSFSGHHVFMDSFKVTEFNDIFNNGECLYQYILFLDILHFNN